MNPPDDSSEAIFEYRDARGNLLYEVLRFPGKKFRQRRPDPQGAWRWDLEGVERVPYRLDEVSLVDQVFLVEGEKDVESLAGLKNLWAARSGSAAARKGGFEMFPSVPDSNTTGARSLGGRNQRPKVRPGSLSGTLAFFDRLSRHASRCWADSFTELFLRTVLDLLTRVHQGGSVSEDAWIGALEEVRRISNSQPPLACQLQTAEPEITRHAR